MVPSSLGSVAGTMYATATTFPSTSTVAGACGSTFATAGLADLPRRLDFFLFLSLLDFLFLALGLAGESLLAGAAALPCPAGPMCAH